MTASCVPIQAPATAYPEASLVGLPIDVKILIVGFIAPRHINKHSTHKNLAILSVCRQLYHELWYFMLDRVIFDLTISEWGAHVARDLKFIPRIRACLSSMPKAMLAKIKHIRSFPSFDWVLALLLEFDIELEYLHLACERNRHRMWVSFTGLDKLIDRFLQSDMRIKRMVLPGQSPSAMRHVHRRFVGPDAHYATYCEYLASGDVLERNIDRTPERYFTVRVSKHGEEEKIIEIIQRM